MSLHSIEASERIQFCDGTSRHNPSLKLVSDFLFYEGLTVLGLLEAQKYGDSNKDMLFTKILALLQFTIRGINYGPALVYHLEMAQLRPVEHEAIQNLWVVNKCSSPGHFRPQDQNLEAMFNNSTKNCFKPGTVQNVLNKSSLIQESERCNKNLKDELSLSNSTAKQNKA